MGFSTVTSCARLAVAGLVRVVVPSRDRQRRHLVVDAKTTLVRHSASDARDTCMHQSRCSLHLRYMFNFSVPRCMLVFSFCFYQLLYMMCIRTFKTYVFGQ